MASSSSILSTFCSVSILLLLLGALISGGFNQIIGSNMVMAFEDGDSSMMALLPFGSASGIGSFVHLPQCGGPRFTSEQIGEQIGVCYGQLGDNLPPQREVVALFNKNNITKMRLYDSNIDCLDALRGSNIELMLGLQDLEVERISGDPVEADEWVRKNVIHFRDVKLKYIVVGNAIQPSCPNALLIVPAMENMQYALSRARLAGHIKVSTAIDTRVLASSFPPSNGSFTDEALSLLNPIISFLNDYSSPLLVNLYPYFTYSNDPTTFSLDYALFTAPASAVVFDGQLHYQNLFDAILDAFYAALEKTNGGGLEIVISETGWPSARGISASVDNARTYNNHLIRHIKGGTPKRPGRPIQTYIYAMFDENQKSSKLEQHFGIFSPIKQRLKYPVNFNGDKW